MVSRWLLAVALLAVPLSGCTGASHDVEPANAQGPAEIHDERSIDLGLEPASQVRAAPCQSETSRCFVYTFDTAQPTALAAQLAWSNPANDLDLYLYPYAEDEPVDRARDPPPSTSEALEAHVEPGTYRIVVVAQVSAQETYSLDVTFPSG